MQKYIVNSFLTDTPTSDKDLEAWLNERGAKGYRLVKITEALDNNRASIVVVMEHDGSTTTAVPATTPEKAS